MEALAQVLADNPRGILVFRDELAGLFGGFDRYSPSKGGDVAYWLEIHGARPIMIDRKTGDQKVTYVRRPNVSIAGTIQPGALKRVLGQQYVENGLAGRFLLAMPARRQKRWTDDEVDADVAAGFQQIFKRLFEMKPAASENDDYEPVILPLTESAKQVFERFVNEHGQEQTALEGALSAAWSKLEAYAARLALNIHCIRVAEDDKTLEDPGRVDQQSVKAGVRLARWFSRQTRRAYAMLDVDVRSCRRIHMVDVIKRRGGHITARDLAQACSWLKSSEEARQALDELVRDSLGKWEPQGPGPQGGRPTQVFVLASIYETSKPSTTPVGRTAEAVEQSHLLDPNTLTPEQKDLYEERAAILEENGMEKEHAEAKAIQQVLAGDCGITLRREENA